MNALTELKTITPPFELYHYTTQTGIMGVLESDSLWATKIHYLNDSVEFKLALSIAEGILQEKLESSGELSNKLRCLLSNLHTIRKINVCVVSLSTKRDLLSQWRAYGGKNGGFSIGFNSTTLTEQAEAQGFYLVKCIYSESEQRRVIGNLIEECLAEDFNMTQGYEDPERPRTIVMLPTGGDFTKKLISIAPAIKNKSFEEESEWRLVSENGINIRSLSFREGTSTLIPYFSLKLGEKSDYLSSVTVGPTIHQELAKDVAVLLLGKYDFGRNCTVHETEIPFRNW